MKHVSLWCARVVTALAVGAVSGASGCSTPDSRTLDERSADNVVAGQVLAALRADPYLDSDHVVVEAQRGVVRLSGMVETDIDLRRALKDSASVRGVKDVQDDLEIIEFGRRK